MYRLGARFLVYALFSLCFLPALAGIAQAAGTSPPAAITVPRSDLDGLFTVSWSASATPGATYVLEEATDSAFTSGLRIAYTGPNLLVKIRGRGLYTTYFYRVRATMPGLAASAWKRSANGCAVPGNGATASPTTITVPSSYSTRSFRVKWAASDTPGATYILQESTNSSFIYNVRTIDTGTLPRALLTTDRQWNTTYYYRVRAEAPGYRKSPWRTAGNGCRYTAPAPAPPTSKINLVVNLDQGEVNEETEIRLFDAWDARNVVHSPGTPPIDPANYEFVTKVKVIDNLGNRHELSVYFDRTTVDNQWEFLVTCQPAADERLLSAADRIRHAPFVRYNYAAHKGAGALLYGVINFSTRGEIDTIQAWNVPPDCEVNPALNTNRVTIDPTESHPSFLVNLSGASVNRRMVLNLGATYTGVATAMPQVLVSDKAAYSDTTAMDFITRETTWNSVFDYNANGLAAGDSFTWTGFRHDGAAVSGFYTINNAAIDKVQRLLDALSDDFGGTASISNGKIMLADHQGGESAMYVTTFVTDAASGADPFGAHIDINTSKRQVVSTGRGLATATGLPVIKAETKWASVYSDAGIGPVMDLQTFVFSGTRSDGTPVPPSSYMASTFWHPYDTVQGLLNWLSNKFDCNAAVDLAGRLVLTDWVADSSIRTSALSVTVEATGTGPDIFGKGQTFDILNADVAGEDGSRQGAMESSEFALEPLFSTQYSNTSMVIFSRVE